MPSIIATDLVGVREGEEGEEEAEELDWEVVESTGEVGVAFFKGLVGSWDRTAPRR